MKVEACLLLAIAAKLAHSANIDRRALPKIKQHFTEGLASAKLFAAPPDGNEIISAGWKVTCDSFEPGNECVKAIDGNNGSFWHTAINNANLPHEIVVDLGLKKNVNGLSALPRQDGNNHGWITTHEVAVSADNRNWETVALGTWYGGDATAKFANFETRFIRYLRLRATGEAGGNQWTSLAELKVYEAKAGPTEYNGKGQWGPTINFPTIPVAGAVDPLTGKILVWSSYGYDSFQGTQGNRLFTALWDPATNVVTPKLVDNTDHDMFCPGISIDGTGQMVVTGGNSARKTTLYDFVSQTWIKAADMNVARGYQSSVTLSDGRVFTIGGSWSGGQFIKNGEVYDPRTKSWTPLNGADVKPMLTNDKRGLYRSDNHGWLFGWKNGTVLQAGPSTAMNWYTTDGAGGVTPAGKRSSSRGADPDSMNGNAVMYDAVQGKILTVGGSPSYDDSSATANAHIITVGDAGAQAQVKFASNGMYSARAFHSSVVLPDGTVFITGGQSYAVPFSDENAQLTPELYDPVADAFHQQQPNSIVRVYHSLALLMHDGRVFSAGGGLCGGGCKVNHFDGQIFTPQYLLTSSGQPATRPVIQSVTQSGRSITIATDSAVDSASLVRFGTATHAVNTDQRRIPLTLHGNSTTQYITTVPSDPGVLTPGYYMLFVMNSKGVPSVSKTVQFLI